MNLDVFVSLAEAARLTHRTKAAVAHWRDRGWVTPTGERRYLSTRRLGRTLRYRFGDLLEAERDTHLNPKSRRKAAA